MAQKDVIAVYARRPHERRLKHSHMDRIDTFIVIIGGNKVYARRTHVLITKTRKPRISFGLSSIVGNRSEVHVDVVIHIASSNITAPS